MWNRRASVFDMCRRSDCPDRTGVRVESPRTWQQVRDQFEASNPSLRAARMGIDESKAQEITAYLRPNPDVSMLLDQIDPFSSNPYRPLSYTLPLISASYLHERQHKRELRLESAQKGTAISASEEADLERTLLFTLRNAFVQTLQAKAVLDVANENLAYYDRALGLSADRFRAGDIAQMDYERLELQRVQFHSDINTAQVNVRTAKIQLLALLTIAPRSTSSTSPARSISTENLTNVDEYRQIALDARPDLQAARQTVDKARTDHRLAVANGSTDPTFGLDLGRNPPIPAYMGVSVSIPLRIFDRNQGEKARTQIDIRRNERLQDAATAQVFSDVDSAYAMLNSNLGFAAVQGDVPGPCRQGARHGVVRLSARRSVPARFSGAQNDYRSVHLNYLNLVGSYLTAASQLNLAVGREVIQ